MFQPAVVRCSPRRPGAPHGLFVQTARLFTRLRPTKANGTAVCHGLIERPDDSATKVGLEMAMPCFNASFLVLGFSLRMQHFQCKSSTLS